MERWQKFNTAGTYWSGGGTFFSCTPSVSPSVQSHSFTQKIFGNAGGGEKLVIEKQACTTLERRQGA